MNVVYFENDNIVVKVCDSTDKVYKSIRKVIQDNFPWLPDLTSHRGTPATIVKSDRECVYSFVFVSNLLVQIDKMFKVHNNTSYFYEFNILGIKFVASYKSCLEFFITETCHWYTDICGGNNTIKLCVDALQDYLGVSDFYSLALDICKGYKSYIDRIGSESFADYIDFRYC